MADSRDPVSTGVLQLVLGPKASSLVLEVVESIEKEYFTVEAVDGDLTDEQTESEEDLSATAAYI